MRCFFLAFFLILLSNPGFTAKLYKIVDENGNVTFSQYPPKDKTKQSAKIEDLSINTGGVTKLTQRDESSYCGDIRLPKKPDRKSRLTNYAETLDDYTDSWQESLSRLEQQTSERSQRKVEERQRQNKYKFKNSHSYQAKRDSYYQKSQASDVQRMRDLRCALRWAKNQGAVDSATLANLKGERQRLESLKAEIEAKMENSCGPLPKYDPTIEAIKYQRKEWYTCSSKYRKDIKVLDNKIKRL